MIAANTRVLAIQQQLDQEVPFPWCRENGFTARSSESEFVRTRNPGTPDALMDIRPAIALVPQMVGHLELYWVVQKRTRGTGDGKLEKNPDTCPLRPPPRKAHVSHAVDRRDQDQVQKRRYRCGQAFFLCAGGISRSLYSPAAAGATRAFLLPGRLFNCLL
jgi:hypothetical protein